MTPPQYIIRLCSTLSCHTYYRTEDFIRVIEHELGIKPGQTSPDGKFRLEIADCLGMCFHAPSMMVNEDRYQDLTADRVRKVLQELKSN